jgi:outer membrane protein TolC
MLGHRWSARSFRFGTVLCIALGAAASGCASFSPDGGMGAVSDIAAPELHADVVKIGTDDDAAGANERVFQLLKPPLSADTAVRIALLNNKGLQAAYNQLGVAEATMVESSLPPNPTFALSRVSTPVELDVEERIVMDILALATLPARAEIAAERFRQAQLRAAEETLRIGAQARRNYYRAVAALELVGSLGQAASAAESSAKLAKQLTETGALNKLDLAREDAFQADVMIQLAKAREQAAGEREQLVRVMGLSGHDPLKLPKSLPGLPKHPRTQFDSEAEALRKRVDLEIARIEIDALAKSYGLTKATRFINLLEVAGVARTQRDPGGPHGTGGGVEADFQIPIFDFGEVRMRQAEETYMAAVNRLSQKAVDVSSQARQAYQAYRSSYDIADRYRRQVLPLRKTISDETMLRYGAMQIDVFSLLTDARQRIAANVGAIEAVRDFWLASTDLDAAIVGGGDGSAATTQSANSTAGE